MDPHSFYLPDPHSEKLLNPDPQKMVHSPEGLVRFKLIKLDIVI